MLQKSMMIHSKDIFSSLFSLRYSCIAFKESRQLHDRNNSFLKNLLS
ncbi:MAG: hypothetical protein ACI90V_006720 [Bacillariaceae sp.]|jgi:hypothetical protein